MVLSTQRLIMRRWLPTDLEPFAAMNADPEVMRYFPAPLTRTESDALVERIEARFAEQDFGLWAVEERVSGSFIGFVGLNQPQFEAHFTPTVEVGWRLARSFWSYGYATEAARRALDYGFEVLDLPEIVSFTAKINTRSIAVMKRLGMISQDQDNFDHPLVPQGHPLQLHVLYRLPRDHYYLNLANS